MLRTLLVMRVLQIRSVLDFLHLGSSLSVRSFSRMSSAISIMDFLHLGSSLSMRSFARVASGLSVFGDAKSAV